MKNQFQFQVRSKRIKYLSNVKSMDSLLKKLTELTNFQIWVLFYIIKNEKINIDVKEEINNFCDKTKDSIDLNNFDSDMQTLQKELNYFAEEGLFQQSTSIHYTLTTKGDLYCFQNLNRHLDKLKIKSVVTSLTQTKFYTTSKLLCDKIFQNHYNLKTIADILIGDPKDTMTRIQIFAEIIRNLSNM